MTAAHRGILPVSSLCILKPGVSKTFESYSEMRSRKTERKLPLIRTRSPMNEAGAITVREPYP